MLAKQIIRIVLYGVGLGSLSALVYFAGPLVAFGDWHPLENYIIRDITLVLLVAAVASFDFDTDRWSKLQPGTGRLKLSIAP